MIFRSTLLHLRIPFSLYLMPVFCFAVASSSQPNWWNVFIVFIAIHIFLYPASNGYNSYFDKDECSIGGLENPPPVNKELYRVSLLFDAVAIAIGLFISWQFALMLFIYGLVSKAYSHPYIRLKKNGLLAWLAAGIFQGGFTYLMVRLASNNYNFDDLWKEDLLLASAICTAMIFGFYPMTQIYQHEEDSRRGDITISYKLGVLGTFYFCAFWFLVAATGFCIYFTNFYSSIWFWIFLVFISPLLIYFAGWYFKVSKNISEANFRSTMKLNKIAAYSLIVFFTIFSIYMFW